MIKNLLMYTCAKHCHKRWSSDKAIAKIKRCSFFASQCRQILNRGSYLTDCNFIVRMLHVNSYWLFLHYCILSFYDALCFYSLTTSMFIIWIAVCQFSINKYVVNWRTARSLIVAVFIKICKNLKAKVKLLVRFRVHRMCLFQHKLIWD